MSTSVRSLIFRGVFVCLIAVGLAAGVGGFWFYDQFLKDLPDFERLEDYRPPLTSVVLDRNGRLIGEFYDEKRRLVPSGGIPRAVQLAFVAAEDKSFFEHKGLDYSSILRAAVANLRGGGIKQGASTITQQMVKSLLLSPERTFRRKFREMILALRIEAAFTKDEILYLYVNQIYFGHGAWGIGQAARDYYGKEVKDLTLSEAALLAGLPQRPSEYSPYRDPAAAERRRRYVLGRMYADGFIDRETHRAALEDRPVIRPHPETADLTAAAHLTETVRRYLYDKIGSDTVLRGGLTIETTLDLDLQKAAVEAVRQGLRDHDRRRGFRGPLRQIPSEDMEKELRELGDKNAALLAGSRKPAKPMTPDADPPENPIPLDRPLEGLVTSVDSEANTATVAFAPGLEKTVQLEDVRWAREVDPKLRPRSVTNIETLFTPGDVARFILKEVKQEKEDAAAAHDESEFMPEPSPFRLGLFQEPIVQGALISFENETGEVLSLVGGYNYKKSEFNRALQAKRQPGSAFKPFIYGAALEKGYTPVSEVVDRPVVYTDPASGFIWAPRNYGRKFHGPIPIRNALKKSVNNATVHLFRDIGVNYVIEYARRFGIQSPLAHDLSLALGSSELTLLEVTTAYAVFANKGLRVQPRFIRRVTSRDGEVLLENVPLGPTPPPLPPWPEPDEAPAADSESEALAALLAELAAREWAQSEGDDKTEDDETATSGEPVFENRVISEAAAYLMSDLLQAVVREGTGRGVKHLGHPLGAKTGTTNEQGDAWFIGFSPEITTGVWVGNDDNSVLGSGETGAGVALPIWRDFMRVVLAGRDVRDFEVPDRDIVFQRIDRETGLLADAGTRNAYFQPFLKGTEPLRSVSERDSEAESRRVLREDIF